MKNIIKVSKKLEASINNIRDLEKLLSLNISKELADFIIENNGGVPDINGHRCLVKVKIDDYFSTSFPITNFTSIEVVKEEFEHIEYLKELYEHFELTDEYVEWNQLFPIADHPVGGIYYANDGKHKGKIYCVDSGDFGIIWVANSLAEFLNNLIEDK